MDIPQPDINLNAGSGNHGKMTGVMLQNLEEIFLDKKPDAVLVYGDTNSTLAGALAASKLHIPVAHVEAGLRSFMMEMPEEQNRRLTDHLSSWLFCPTQTAINNLQCEGIVNQAERNPTADKKHVSQTGDIMYEASLYYRQKAKDVHQYFDGITSNFILLTIHRAENTDNVEKLSSIVKAINSLDAYSFVFPIHPRTRKILAENNLHLASHVKMIDPVGYLEMIALENACTAVVTDSGGVQKEAYFFKRPCITLRDATEWVELVASGWNTLAETDSHKIINAVQSLYIPDTYPSLYGDGKCAEKIVSALVTIS
jgi:UDP-GlcNAc3NAcA epimerase